MPTRVGGLVDVVRSPAYAAGVGLVLYGAQLGRQAAQRSLVTQPHDRGLFRRAWSRLSEIF
jgi:cell division protein FtsA